MNIQSKRKEKGFTQAILADRLSVSRSTIAKWECGNVCPTVRLLPKIAAVLNCRIDDLFTQEELEGKASAQTLLPEAHSEGHPGGDTPPWADDDDLTGILE